MRDVSDKDVEKIKTHIVCPVTLQNRAFYNTVCKNTVKVKVNPQQAEVAQEVPGRLRPMIFLALGITRVVSHQPYAPVAFTPGEIPGTHFQRLSRPQGTWFLRGEPRKKSPVTPPGIGPRTVRNALNTTLPQAPPKIL